MPLSQCLQWYFLARSPIRTLVLRPRTRRGHDITYHPSNVLQQTYVYRTNEGTLYYLYLCRIHNRDPRLQTPTVARPQPSSASVSLTVWLLTDFYRTLKNVAMTETTLLDGLHSESHRVYFIFFSFYFCDFVCRLRNAQRNVHFMLSSSDCSNNRNNVHTAYSFATLKLYNASSLAKSSDDNRIYVSFGQTVARNFCWFSHPHRAYIRTFYYLAYTCSHMHDARRFLYLSRTGTPDTLSPPSLWENLIG